jgi:hypothetical protein
MKNTQTSTKTQTKTAGVQPENVRKNIYMNREVKKRLGSTYSYEDELYYIGHPLVFGATEHENEIVAAIERNLERSN